MLTLLLFTGAARVEVLRLGWQNIRGGRIEYRRQKTMNSGGAPVSVMILPELQRVLDGLPSDRLTFLQTRLGRSRTPGGVSQQMTRWVAEAGIGGKDVFGRRLGPHGLSKALARRLVEAGALPTDVAAVPGQRDVKSAMICFRDHDRGRAADTAMERLGNISLPKSNVLKLKKP